MKTRTHTLTLLLLSWLLIASPCAAVTRVCVSSGDWADPSSWSPAGVPACGDSVVICMTHTVSISTQQNYETCQLPMKIRIFGTLKFNLGSKLRLPCGSIVVVYQGGALMHDNGNQNSNYIEICQEVVWNSNSDTYGPLCYPVTDPFCGAFLPVELSYFDAELCSGTKVCLQWETLSEKHSSRFEVERSSDGSHFVRMGSVPSRASQGNSSSALVYGWMDEAPAPGFNFYRLKQVDLDESFVYSPVSYTKARSRSSVSAKVSPNPGNDEFHIQLSGPWSGAVAEIKLTDIAGVVVYQSISEIHSASLDVKPGHLSAGLYLCSLRVGDQQQVMRIIVSKS